MPAIPPGGRLKASTAGIVFGTGAVGEGPILRELSHRLDARSHPESESPPRQEGNLQSLKTLKTSD